MKKLKKKLFYTIKDKSIIHFACHGQFNHLDPINSGIKLSDNVLTAIDFMNIEMNANLMVLSACETALGEIIEVDEVEGLVRSIQYSGCRFVIASLWPVDDESTKTLFSNFYSLSGEYVDRIRNSKVDLIKKYDIYDWAPFQIYGI